LPLSLAISLRIEGSTKFSLNPYIKVKFGLERRRKDGSPIGDNSLRNSEPTKDIFKYQLYKINGVHLLSIRDIDTYLGKLIYYYKDSVIYVTPSLRRR